MSQFQFWWPRLAEHLYRWHPDLVPPGGDTPRVRLGDPGDNACRRVASQNTWLMTLGERGPAVPVPTSTAMRDDAERRAGPSGRVAAPTWRHTATDICVVDEDTAEVARLLPESCIVCAVRDLPGVGLPPPAASVLASLCRAIPALLPGLQAHGGLPRPGTILRFSGLEILRCPTTLHLLEGALIVPTCDLVLTLLPPAEEVDTPTVDQVSALDAVILRALRGAADSGRPSVVFGGFGPDSVGLPPLYTAHRLRAVLEHASVRGYFRSVTLADGGPATGPGAGGLGMLGSVLCAMCTKDNERRPGGGCGGSTPA